MIGKAADIFKLAKIKGYFIRDLQVLDGRTSNIDFFNKSIIGYINLETYYLQKWLRDEKDIRVSALPHTNNDNGSYKWIWMIHRVKASTAVSSYFDSYEDALLDGVGEALKLI